MRPVHDRPGMALVRCRSVSHFSPWLFFLFSDDNDCKWPTKAGLKRRPTMTGVATAAAIGHIALLNLTLMWSSLFPRSDVTSGWFCVCVCAVPTGHLCPRGPRYGEPTVACRVFFIEFYSIYPLFFHFSRPAAA